MKQQKGFTLIELLVVIAIIGLLSTLAIVALNSARQKSRDARRLSDVKQIQTALELYFNDFGAFPIPSVAGTEEALGTAALACLDSTGLTTAGCSNGTVYMAQVPTNPSPTTDGTCADEGYMYNAIDDSSTYRLRYCIGGTSGGITAGPNTACEAGISGCTE